MMTIQSIQASAISATIATAFDFTVDKFPLSGPDGLSTPWYALFRSDTSKAVGNGSVTGRYVPHTTEDVCALVDAAAATFQGEIECKTHFRDGHYVSLRPTRDERRRIFGESDNVWPAVMINAGYDGKAFVAQMGYYRDACRNLAFMRKVSGTVVKIRHTRGLRDHMDDLIKSFGVLKQSWGTLSTVIDRLQSTETRIVDFLDSIYGRPTPEQLQLAAAGQSVRAVTVHENRTAAIWKRLNNERNLTGRPMLGETVSLWEAYNAIQGYVQHAAQSKTGFKGDFDRILRASRDEYVHAAEDLVLELAS